MIEDKLDVIIKELRWLIKHECQPQKAYLVVDRTSNGKDAIIGVFVNKKLRDDFYVAIKEAHKASEFWDKEDRDITHQMPLLIKE